MKVYVDLTEFLAAPNRTGIQRVCGELCRHWPSDIQAQPVKVAPGGGLVETPRKTFDLIREYFNAKSEDAGWALRLRGLNDEADSRARRVTLTKSDRVLVPELFYDPNRLAFFEGLDSPEFDLFHFIIYDFLPLTHPQFFDQMLPHQVICRYFRLVRRARNVGFISRATKETFLRRICREESHRGVVLRLGSDGLGPTLVPRRIEAQLPSFVVIGTIEPRKNHRLILDALEPLMEETGGFRLIFAGKMGPVEKGFAERIRMLSARGGAFTFVEAPSDARLRRVVRSARASIFASAAEGFGLPACESLWLQVPVIAAPGIPSLEDIRDCGVHLLEPLDAKNIRAAVVALLDDTYHEKKVREAAGLNLPTWRSFARQVAGWVAAQ